MITHTMRKTCLSMVSLTKPDAQHRINVLQQQENTDTQLKYIQDATGITADGWASNQEYEGAVERARFMKRQGLGTEEEKEMTLTR